MTLLKYLIAPVQQRLIDKHLCPGCTRNLDKSIRREPQTTDTEVVTCSCEREYIYQRSHRRYTRLVKSGLNS